MTDTKLTKQPHRVDKQIVEAVAEECGISTETVLHALLTILKLTDWDPEDAEKAKIFIAEAHRDFPSTSN